MAKVVTSYGNFAKGQIDHDMMGRYDLPIYTTGMDVFENFISNFKGNATFSPGFLSQIAFQDCAFVEFKFGITQNYLCLFYAGKVRFLAFDTNGNFGWVLSGGSPLEVVSPYSLADAKTIAKKGSYSQNFDVMVIAHRSYPPYKLTRTGAASFTLATYTRTNDPFTGAGLYPGAVCFYKGRLFFASTSNKGTSVWMSVSGSYDDFTQSATLEDSTGFAFTLADISQQIEWLYPGDNSLIAGSTDGIVAINGGGVNTSITPSTVVANITSAEPTNGVYPIKKDGLVFYIGRTGRNCYYFKYDILSEAFLAQDANVVAYDITTGGLTKIRFRKDREDMIYFTRGDGNLCSLSFKEAEKINGWASRTTNGVITDMGVMGDNNGNPQLFILVLRNGTYYIEQQASLVEFAKRSDFWTPGDDDNQDEFQDMDDEAYNRFVAEQLRGCVYLDGAMKYADLRTSTITYDPNAGTVTSSSSDFSSGDVGKHIVYKTLSGYESGRFLIKGYTSPTVVTVDVLQTPKAMAGVALNVWASWYKSFSTLNGLSQYNGQIVGVVADGGYLASYVISGGTLSLDRQITSVVIGLQYTGMIKSMCLGFSFQGNNTQTTLKNIVRAGMRLVASSGGRIGSSLYNLEAVQTRSQADLNYLPPLPIDGTKYVDYADDSEEDKFFYVVQDQPLPFKVACVALEANYSVGS